MDLEAFILIGGRSTRYGSDKAFAEFEGESLASRAARIVEAAFPGVRTTFIAATEEQFGIETRRLDRPVVFDRRPGFGAWSGLYTALFYSKAEWTLLLACDLPFMTKGYLRRVADERTTEVDAIVSRDADGRIQPLCAMYRSSAVRDLVERESSNNAERLPPLRDLFAEIRATFVDAADGELRNVNTPSDLL